MSNKELKVCISLEHNSLEHESLEHESLKHDSLELKTPITRTQNTDHSNSKHKSLESYTVIDDPSIGKGREDILQRTSWRTHQKIEYDEPTLEHRYEKLTRSTH